MTITFTARLAVITGAAALALAACAPGTDPAAGPETAPATSQSPDDAMTDDAMEDDAMDKEDAGDDAMADDAMEEDAMKDVPEQLQFSTVTLAGDDFDGASLAGQDAILWVWASWCPVCQAEAPAVEAASTQLPAGVTLYGLPGRADASASQAFVDDYGLGGFDHIFDEDGSLWANFGVAYQPAFVLINDDGSIDAIPGSLSEDGIIEAAQTLASS